ncbi:MAG TPA: protein-methionine-sulfoxide reductase catalytic subunit MsrP [Stellaceae bacterium]|jgi:sulfoxide reductase catalytic subunit YedY|nr:protein-methionine-sulfoxide reductase catalytic subunit MsrP [Stellaceae bacterium]
MLVKVKRGWEIPESEATPEAAFLDRRNLLKAMGMGSLAAAAGAMLPARAASAADAAVAADPSAGLYPAKRDEKYTLDRPLTDEKLVTHYNNFYEYGEDKDIADRAQQLKIRPWTITIDGMVEKPQTLAIDDLLKKVQLEERLYRHRCVEAWSLAVPWTGFPLKTLVNIAKPLSGAKYIQMTTFFDKAMAPGQKMFWYPWPYIEGVTMDEAMNELSLLGTGMYGHPMPKQDGAPLRLVLPWKYGFKSIKSIVKFSFVDKRPVGLWEKLQPQEYGFWANVNPAVPHPRWSQATERVIGSNKRVPTLIWNGYGEFVAHLYDNLKGERLFA